MNFFLFDENQMNLRKIYLEFFHSIINILQNNQWKRNEKSCLMNLETQKVKYWFNEFEITTNSIQFIHYFNWSNRIDHLYWWNNCGKQWIMFHVSFLILYCQKFSLKIEIRKMCLIVMNYYFSFNIDSIDSMEYKTLLLY